MLLDLEHVTARTNSDGSLRYYFRRRGQPLTRLPGLPNSPEFAAAYQRCLDWVAPSAGQTEGTLAWACEEYMKSTAFKSKAEATRSARKRVIVSMLNERIDPSYPDIYGNEKIKALTRTDIQLLRDRKAEFPNAANERLKILRQVFKMAADKGWSLTNLARDVENLTILEDEGHPTASDEQLEKFFAFHPPGTRAHQAMTILKQTGVRVSDLRVLGSQHMRHGVLSFRTKKTNVLCQLPVGSELQSVLPSAPECDNLTFLTSELGRPYKSDKAMSARVVKWIRQAGIEEITGHGIRKWLATKMAEAGVTEWELCSWFGWKDPKEARPYVQAANRQKMAQEVHAKLGRV